MIHQIPAPMCRVDNEVRRVWQDLALAGARVPMNPLDLDVTHLVRARQSGLDVGAILDGATPRSA